MIKKPRLTLQIILGAALLTTIITTGCNSGDDKKASTKDSAATKMMPADSSKMKGMDTASTRPVQTPN